MNTAPEAATDPLSAPVRALFAALQHSGLESPLPQPLEPGSGLQTLRGEAGRRELGTRIMWRLTLQGRRLLQARYSAYGCPHTLATCEWLAQQLEAAAPQAPFVEQRLQSIGSPTAWAERLQIPPAKLGRLLIIEDALRTALAPLTMP